MRGRERKGKVIMFGGGSLRPSQRRAEKVARRSQKRADERAWRQLELDIPIRTTWGKEDA